MLFQWLSGLPEGQCCTRNRKWSFIHLVWLVLLFLGIIHSITFLIPCQLQFSQETVWSSRYAIVHYENARRNLKKVFFSPLNSYDGYWWMEGSTIYELTSIFIVYFKMHFLKKYVREIVELKRKMRGTHERYFMSDMRRDESGKGAGVLYFAHNKHTYSFCNKI